MARPGGNTTGVSILAGDISSKRLELLRTLLPGLSKVAVLFNPDNSFSRPDLARIETGALRIGVKVLPLEVRTQRDLEIAFTSMTAEHVGAVFWVIDAFLNSSRRRIAKLALKHRLPCIGGGRVFMSVKGLMSYGPDPSESIRRAADYVDKIFKGANPGDLPVEQPTKLELVINSKTARALGLTIPSELLLLADRVIE
jgi:putative ABC transport system substrate-binding protein